MEEGGGGAGTLLSRAFALVIIITLLLMAVSFPAGFYAVFNSKLSNSTSFSSPLREVVLLIGLVPVVVPVQLTVGGAFAGFSVIYAVFLITAALQNVRISAALRQFGARNTTALFLNPLAATLIALGALSFGLTLLDIVQTKSGIPTGQITGDPLYIFLGITMAPLTEEFGFRLVLTGVPLFIVLALSRSPFRTAVKTLWRPSAAWEEAAAGNGGTAHTLRRLFAYVLVAVSSVVFGLAHYLANTGWGVGKVSEAAIAGVVLGYMYTRYGFHTNVLLHWGVNYFGTAFAFFSQGIWNIPWTSDTGSSLSLLVEVVVLLALGLPSFILVLYNFLKKASGAGDVVA